MKNLSYLTVVIAASLLLGACQTKRPASAPLSVPPPSKEFRTVYYDLDQAVIRTDQTDALIGNATVMKDFSHIRINIEGHCDERGTNEYNLALGDRRARSAKNYLVNMGVDPSRMNVMSYGEERPVCTEHNENCWWRNRRAEFVK